MGVIKIIETFSVKILNPKWKFYVTTVIVIILWDVALLLSLTMIARLMHIQLDNPVV